MSNIEVEVLNQIKTLISDSTPVQESIEDLLTEANAKYDTLIANSDISLTNLEEIKTNTGLLASIDTNGASTAANTSSLDSKADTANGLLTSIDGSASTTNTLLTTSNNLITDIDNNTTLLNSKIDTTNTNLASIETKIDLTNTNLDTVNSNISSTNTKLDTIDTSITSTNTKIDTTNSNLGTINTNIDSSNTKLDTISALISTTNSKIDTTNTDLTTINSSITSSNTKLDTINTSVGASTTAIESLYIDPFAIRIKASLSSTYGGIQFWRICGNNPNSISAGSTGYFAGYTPLWLQDSDNKTLQVASSSTSDASPSGGGTRTIYIEYFNTGNNTFYSETVAMNGQTPVTLSNLGSYVTFMRVASRGSSNSQPSGNIACSNSTFTAGVPPASVGSILANDGFCTSYFAAYIPSTATKGYLLDFQACCSEDSVALISARVLPANSNAIIKRIYCPSNQPVNLKFTSDNVLPPDTVVWLQVTNVSANSMAYCSAELNGCYI